MEFIGPRPSELEKMREGSYIAEVLPYINDEIEGMIKVTRTRIFASITDGTYTIEKGDSAWRELYAYYRLIKRLETKIRVGRHVGGKVSESMTIGDSND